MRINFHGERWTVVANSIIKVFHLQLTVSHFKVITNPMYMT